jgi:hypothetical protein
MTSDGKMSAGLEGIWKEAAVALSMSYPGLCLEGSNKNTETSVRIDEFPAEIRTQQHEAGCIFFFDRSSAMVAVYRVETKFIRNIFAAVPPAE